MRYNYGEFDGTPFPTPDSLFPAPKVVQFILQYGQKALEAMEKLEGDEEREYIEAMIAAGLLERDEKTGHLRLTPKMVRGLEHRSLLEVFQVLQRGSREGHQTFAPGRSDERSEGTKPYQFGDALSDLDVAATMRNALHHWRAGEGAARGSAGAEFDPPQVPRRRALPLHIRPADFELHVTEGQSDVSLCLLLDQSGSMMRYGRFYQAKRVALGMAHLMRSRFPQDTLDFVGFYSTASRIPERDLPLVLPKPITLHEYRVRLRVPLDQALAQPQRFPQHFTNLHMGLRLARQILGRRPAANKIIFIITDGQPTAHLEPHGGGDGDLLYLLYPPSERTATATLKEAMRCMQQGLRIASFALIEDYFGMDWVGFVDHLTRLTRGVAYYCTSEDLSSTVIESYLSGRKRKTFVG